MFSSLFQIALFKTDKLSKHSNLCSILHGSTSPAVVEVQASRVYFSNKTKGNSEMMELSWLYLIEFDQVPACCLSNLLTSL